MTGRHQPGGLSLTDVPDYSPIMKISCPNPSCCQHLSGPKALMGRRFSCPACGHSFIWTDCFHAGDSFVI
jgi:hypothetical protein